MRRRPDPALAGGIGQKVGLDVEKIRALTVRALDVNNTVAPYDDPKVLQAISHATDRQALVDGAYFGRARRTSSRSRRATSPTTTRSTTCTRTASPRRRSCWPRPVTRTGSPSRSASPTPTARSPRCCRRSGPRPASRPRSRCCRRARTTTSRGPTRSCWTATPAAESPLQALEVLLRSGGPDEPRPPTPRSSSPAAIDAARATPTDAADYQEKLENAVSIGVKNMPNTFLFTWPRILIHPKQVTGLQHWIDVQRWEDVTVSG